MQKNCHFIDAVVQEVMCGVGWRSYTEAPASACVWWWCRMMLQGRIQGLTVDDVCCTRMMDVLLICCWLDQNWLFFVNFSHTCCV